mgnify:CR=1 FL=1
MLWMILMPESSDQTIGIFRLRGTLYIHPRFFVLYLDICSTLLNLENHHILRFPFDDYSIRCFVMWLNGQVVKSLSGQIDDSTTRLLDGSLDYINEDSLHTVKI